MPTVFGIPLWIFIIIIIFAYAGASTGIFQGGKSLKKATSMALNADLIKGGYKAYKKITGNQ
jgi:hypothetical protein